MKSIAVVVMLITLVFSISAEDIEIPFYGHDEEHDFFQQNVMRAHGLSTRFLNAERIYTNTIYRNTGSLIDIEAAIVDLIVVAAFSRDIGIRKVSIMMASQMVALYQDNAGSEERIRQYIDDIRETASSIW